MRARLERMLISSLVSVAFVLGIARAQDGPGILSVGDQVEVLGALDGGGRFVADEVQLLEPGKNDSLIGIVPSDQTDPSRFTVLGQHVEVGADTGWKKLEPGPMAGKRVKVDGSWDGSSRFIALEISPRDEGRDRIRGRIDEIVRDDGGAWRARIMKLEVLIPDAVQVAPLPERKQDTPEAEEGARDEDDVFGEGIALTDSLRLSGQIEGKTTIEDNFDLDDQDDEDRKDYELDLRARFTWTPSGPISAVTELRFSQQWRHDQQDGNSSDQTGQLGETWILWRDVFGDPSFDLGVGRQDFDDSREWIYDQNLDAVRVALIRPNWRLDVSTSTRFNLSTTDTLSDTAERDKEAWNWIAYLSNNDRKRHLAVWSVYRDIDAFDADGDSIPSEKNGHLGIRAIGRWLPQNRSWFEAAYLLGERESRDIRAWGVDVGTTWLPPFAEPLYFTLGYAFGSGEENPEGNDSNFRQTGLQDNTARFGGATTFQYYGELLDPELSNLGILTAGVGAMVARKTSLDLVYHRYVQDEAEDEFSPEPGIRANLDQEPNGDDDHLGQELDLVFGFRRFASWDLELVGAWFDPGEGFDDRDDAYLAKIQLRYRF